MLVLTRKSGESIRIGDGIIVTVLDQAGGQVKVGITAPPQVPIHREEIYLKIKAENLAAAQGSKATKLLLKHLPKVLNVEGTMGSGQPDK